MDALEIDAMTQRWSVEELREASMLRELNKLYAAWNTCKGARIATGHWGMTVSIRYTLSRIIYLRRIGCGTFGGHRQTKALLQVMAASRSEAQLHFTSVEDAASGTGSPFGASLARFVDALRAKGVTVGALFAALRSLADAVPHSAVPTPPDVWQLLAKRLELPLP